MIILLCGRNQCGLNVHSVDLDSIWIAVDVKKMFTKSFTEHVSIIFHQIRKHELVTSVEDYNVLMLTSCRFVDCHVKGWR